MFFKTLLQGLKLFSLNRILTKKVILQKSHFKDVLWKKSNLMILILIWMFSEGFTIFSLDLWTVWWLISSSHLVPSIPTEIFVYNTKYYHVCYSFQNKSQRCPEIEKLHTTRKHTWISFVTVFYRIFYFISFQKEKHTQKMT